MNIKLKAALITAGVFFAGYVAALLMNFIAETFTTEQVFYGVMVLCLAGLSYLMYGVVLARLEMEESMKKLSDSL